MSIFIVKNYRSVVCYVYYKSCLFMVMRLYKMLNCRFNKEVWYRKGY